MNLNRLTLVILVLIFNNELAIAQLANRFDILITEIFPDPTPPVGLPQNEFIEIQNVSGVGYNLKDWKLGDGSSVTSISINYILDPDSIVIICTNSAVSLFSSLGNTIVVSNFPSLDNEADMIYLQSREGTIIHAVSYNKNWYQNDLKANGGWSLEMIDTNNPCGGITNWKSSINNAGGTPGKKNSVDGKNKDETAPALLRSFGIDSVTIVTVFDEAMDSTSAATSSNYVLQGIPNSPFLAIPLSPLYTEVILKFPKPLSDNTVYDLSVTNVSDCAGNLIGPINRSKTGLPSLTDTFDIIINEILFNPKSDGFDFIELYNKSKKIIDLQYLYIASRKITGAIEDIKKLSDKPYLLFPGEYLAFTENVQWLKQNYIVKNPATLIELPSLPSMPDDKGNPILLNQQGKMIDELWYDSKWHFALINNNEGISLERIDYSGPTQIKNNWTSAASTAGFATPGYQNSQFRTDLQMQGVISIEPKIFSPDNDGFDDLAIIQYKMTTPGYVANITIFDANGRPVRYFVKNATLALEGKFRWDGLDDKLQQLPVGIYIVFTEVFNLKGKTKRFKNVVTLARRF